MLKHNITIRAEFPSEMQADIAMKVLREYLEEWRATVLAGHQRNKVVITYQEIPVAN